MFLLEQRVGCINAGVSVGIFNRRDDVKTFATLTLAGFMTVAVLGRPASAGPYSSPKANTNAGAIDAAIPGFVGPHGDGKYGTSYPSNYVNPIFKGWATGCTAYEPFNLTEIENYFSGRFSHPESSLGPFTGDGFNLTSLGDMSAAELSAWRSDPINNPGPGSITLSFGCVITDGSGADFAVFENGGSNNNWVFAELAYVEVSTDGVNYAQFPSISLTPSSVGVGSIDATNVYNLAGKHSNLSKNESWGTPFDLDDLVNDAYVIAGLVDLSEINYVRIVDIPGNGSFLDSLGNPIYDAWETYGSGGFDLDAVGAINQVPEPSTLILLAIFSATGAACAIRRRYVRYVAGG